MSGRQGKGTVDVDRVLRDMLTEARENRPEGAWKESIMGAAFNARWGVAIALAAASAVVALAALVFIASPAFTDATASYARVALTGVAPILAILAVVSAAEASSRVLKAPWAAALLAILGSVATSVTYEVWYADVDNPPSAAAPLFVAIGGTILLNGAALAVLVLPSLRQLPVGATVAVLALVVILGGTAALLIVFPMMSTVLISAAAVTAVLLLRRAEGRGAFTTEGSHSRTH